MNVKRRSAVRCGLVFALLLATAPGIFAGAQEILQDNTDGAVGVYLKEVGGSALEALNESTSFEGASTNKTMIHVHAMLEVQDGSATLDEMIPVALDLSGSCPQGTGVVMERLDDALRLMMQESDNARTQAVRDRFGDANISATISALGMNDTLLNPSQTLGCGDQAIDNPNELTAVDLGILYEQVLTGFLDGPTGSQMFDLMLNQGNSFFIDSVVNQEALAAGASAAETLAYKAGILMAHKGGSYTLVENNGTPLEYRSLAGYIDMPFACEGASRQYVYAVYVDGATDLDTQGTGSDVSIFNAARELLRPLIREALDSAVCARAPEVSAPAPITLECNSTGGIDAADMAVAAWLDQGGATDECDDVPTVNDAPGFFPSSCAPGFRTDVVFSATDTCGAEGTAMSSVSVQDTTAPTLSVPADQTVECESPQGTFVSLMSTGSDVCGSVAFTNSRTDGGYDASDTYPLGANTVAWDVVDDCANHTAGWSTVTVVDTTDPVVTCGVARDALFPPNHQFEDVGLWYEVVEDCDAAPDVEVSITSDEDPATAAGAGGPVHCPDAMTDGADVFLRAERAGTQDGRVYVITVTATDASGNVGTCDAVVTVPHDMGAPHAAVDSGQDYNAALCQVAGNGNGNGNGNNGNGNGNGNGNNGNGNGNNGNNANDNNGNGNDRRFKNR